MVREDIVGALRNALERGASLEQAKQSVLNAGYSTEEVEESCNYLHAGSVLNLDPAPVKRPADFVQPSKSRNIPQQPTQPTQQAQSAQSAKPIQSSKGPSFFSKNWKIILLLGVLFILVILFVLVLIFRDTIASWFW